MRAFYEDLLARGKTKLQALVASMRKLLHGIFGMFKHDQLFQGSKVYAALPSTAVPVDVDTPTPPPRRSHEFKYVLRFTTKREFTALARPRAGENHPWSAILPWMVALLEEDVIGTN